MQKRFKEWQQPLVSDDANKAEMGKTWPGRICGFDRIGYVGSGSTFSVGHDTGGITPTDIAGVVGTRTGVWVSPQGVVITEDEAIPGLTLATNAGNSAIRYDLLIATHTYSNIVVGGNPATYAIVQGPSNNPVLPSVPSPNLTIVLGIIAIEPGATAVQALTDLATPPTAPTKPFATYTPTPVKGVGGEVSAKLSSENKFSRYLETADYESATFKTITGSHVALHPKGQSNTILVPDSGGGSSFWINAIKTPAGNAGAKLTVQVPATSGDDICIVHNSGQSIPAGYSKIYMPSHLLIYPTGGSNPTGLQLLEKDLVHLEFIAGFWIVTSVSLRHTQTESAYLSKVRPNPTAYFMGSQVNVIAGTNITLSTFNNPANSKVSLSSGEIRFDVTGRYKIVMHWGLAGNRGNYERMLLASDSSNEPMFAYLSGKFGSEPDFKTGITTIEVDQVSYSMTLLDTIIATTKIGAYINPNGIQCDAYVTVEVTYLG